MVQFFMQLVSQLIAESQLKSLQKVGPSYTFWHGLCNLCCNNLRYCIRYPTLGSACCNLSHKHNNLHVKLHSVAAPERHCITPEFRDMKL